MNQNLIMRVIEKIPYICNAILLTMNKITIRKRDKFVTLNANHPQKPKYGGQFVYIKMSNTNIKVSLN